MVAGRLSQSSRCALSSNRASCHGCTPMTPATHPAEGDTRAISIIESTNSSSVTSPPPHRAGCSDRTKPPSSRSCHVRSLRRRSFASSGASSASCGASCWAVSTRVMPGVSAETKGRSTARLRLVRAHVTAVSAFAIWRESVCQAPAGVEIDTNVPGILPQRQDHAAVYATEDWHGDCPAYRAD